MGNFDKPYEELLFSDNYMFVKAMELYPDYCREMLELLLSVKIDQIESISCEKTIDAFYDAKGIRLDVLMKDSEDNIYDAEMQVVVEPDLPKRARYYHSAIDTDFLLKGSTYDELKPVYVIFICVGKLKFENQRPIYFFRSADGETQTVLDDQEYTVIVNSDYINSNPKDMSISDELKDFLCLVNKGKTQSNRNTLAQRIEKLIEKLKKDNEGRPKYMTLYEELKVEKKQWVEEGREEGRTEGRLEGEIKAYSDMISKGIITPDVAAESLGLTVAEFQSKAKCL